LARCLTALVLLLASTTALSQTFAPRALSGTVADSGARVIVGATVSVVTAAGKQQTVTDSEGQFALTVAPGAFSLHIEGRNLVPLDRQCGVADVTTGIIVQVELGAS
jgi:hypothetical protein